MLRDVSEEVPGGESCPRCGRCLNPGEGGRPWRARVQDYVVSAAQIVMAAIIGLLSVVGAITLLLALEVRGVEPGPGQERLQLKTQYRAMRP
ncbi:MULTISPECIES: hypothetical protein [Sphingobium]|uniref:Uncharacterized protein n=1 Tax=Sphingobium chungbukense TaxID=56193 RepID=A0A0M3APU2_9SPHN|nr:MULTISPECIES: hypothetical protein [Sphingobium]KKW90564.1 hypothetical protein YP76_18400 [Sphingobium chungbukense]